MVIHFGENLDASFKYANGAFKSFHNWFILILLYTLIAGAVIAIVAGALFLLIGSVSYLGLSAVEGAELLPPIDLSSFGEFIGAAILPVLAIVCLGILFILVLDILRCGVLVRVFRGGELSLSNPGKLFVEGFLCSLISLIYLLPYVIVSIATAFGPLDNIPYTIIVYTIIPTILLVISYMISLFAMISYAKGGSFGAAFKFKEIFAKISHVGWLRFLGYIILLNLILGIVVMIIWLIPIVGIILGIIVMPFVDIMSARFLANLYETADE